VPQETHQALRREPSPEKSVLSRSIQTNAKQVSFNTCRIQNVQIQFADRRSLTRATLAAIAAISAGSKTIP
jgi:hypothetical protein